MKTKYIYTILTLLLSAGALSGQNTMSSPVNMGSYSSSFTYTDTKNTSSYINNYTGRSTNDVFYKFTTTVAMDVVISHCGSAVSDTYVYLLNISGGLIASNDDYGGDGKCSSTYHSYLKMTNLAPGTYYVVSEGYSQNGNITTAVQGIVPIIGMGVGSTNQNYIHTRTYTNEAGTTYLDQVQYFDGLGRPVQTVQRGITPTAKDLISIQEYDAFGREDKAWLPSVVSGNNGAYVTPETIKTNAISTNDSDQKPYSMPVYEASPLNRVLKQYGPGADWHKTYGSDSKAAETAYKTNIAGDTKLNCKLYKAGGANQSPTLTQNGNYSTGQLYVTEIKDEDGNTTYEFKDKLGQVVLTRQIENNVNHDTYYVYNDFGLQCYVLPPKIQEEGITQTKLDELAYQYKYDHRNRCIAKKIPGCDWIYYVYDKADRLIFSQDGENRKKGEWQFTIPDRLGRIIASGICTHNLDYTADPMKDMLSEAYFVKAETPYKGYNVINVGSYMSLVALYTVNYYDNYDFRGMSEIPIAGTEYNSESGYGTWYGTDYTEANKYKNKGMLTGTLTAQMNPDGTISPTYLYSVMYYDYRGRLIQSKGNNHLTGGIEKEYIAYNFTGQPTQRKHIHQATGKNTQTEVYAYTYDHAGRLCDTRHSLNGQPDTYLLQNRYDDLGRLARQGIGQQAVVPQSQSAPADRILTMAASVAAPAAMAMVPDTDLPVPAKAIEYIGSLGANGILSHSTLLYANRAYTPDLQFTLQQSGWVTIEYPYLVIPGSTGPLVTTFYTYSNGVYYDVPMADEEDLSTSSVSRIRYQLGAGTHSFNIYSPLRNNTGNAYATIILRTGNSNEESAELDPPEEDTGEGDSDHPEIPEPPEEDTGGSGNGNDNPELPDPVNFTVIPAQVVEYSYNVRSWTNNIANALFSEELAYTYNGNISSMDWQQQGQNNRYAFTYDNLSRLKTAAYTGTGQYGATYGYDKHGNMMNLTRSGKITGNTPYGVIDNLAMTYTGNQLIRVVDNATASPVPDSEDFRDYTNKNGLYTYNANGAMITDSHKGILGIKYNSLNLPQELAVKNINTVGKTYYTYSAAGQKLKVVHKSSSNMNYTPVVGSTAGDTNFDIVATTDYVGNKVYENGSLKILVDGGYYENDKYHFYIKDHLGNNRVVTDQYNNLIQSTQYYPFGTAFADKYDNGSKQPYKYNGKELDQMHGLNLYDYSARYYESAIGRFTTVDPMAEKYYSISPYAYVANNPLKYVDPTGMWIQYSDSTGYYRYNNGQWEQYQTSGANAGQYTAYTATSGSFLDGVLKGLNKLNNNVTGNGLLDFFANDDNNAFIMAGTKNTADITNSARGEITLSSTFQGSDIPTENGVQTSPFWLDIGHELSHRQDVLKNGATQAGATWLTNPDGTTVKVSEKYATHMENQMRADAGLPLRTHYLSVNQGGKLIGGWGPSRILNAGTRTSTFYGTTYRSLPRILIPKGLVPSSR